MQRFYYEISYAQNQNEKSWIPSRDILHDKRIL